MKKAGIFSILIGFGALSGNQIEENTVPLSIVAKFHQQFGQSQALTWHQQENIFKAIALQQGHEIEAFYDIQAQCLEIDRRVSAESLPTSVQQTIQRTFAEGYHIASVYVVDKQNVSPVFKVRIRQGRLTYDMEFEDTNQEDLAFHKKFIK